MPNVSIFHFVSTTTDIRILDRYVLHTSSLWAICFLAPTRNMVG